MTDSSDMPPFTDADLEQMEAMSRMKVSGGWEPMEEAVAAGIQGPVAYAQASALVQAEQSTLGALMAAPETWQAISALVAPTSFGNPEHCEIFKVIADQAVNRLPFDTVSVGLKLQAAGRLDAVGGFAYLSHLHGHVVAPQNGPMYAGIVHAHALRRQGEEAAKAFLTDVQSGEVSVADALDAHQKRLALVQADVRAEQSRPKPMNWRALKGQVPPAREWAIEHWFGMGYVTLMAGSGGLGKTLLAQTIASALSLGRGYADRAPKARKVLLIAGEDDETELWRRQIDICRWLSVDFDAIAERLTVISYKGHDMTVADMSAGGGLRRGPFWNELRDLIGDHGSEYVFLDSSARTFGGNESDRHHVTSYITWLEAACMATGAGLCLLAHPAKAEGSEWSGSTAWEASVRSRLYLGRNLPDQPQADDDAPDDGVRYFCRRKANYAARDYRKLILLNGVLAPEFTADERPIGASFKDRYSKQAKPTKEETAQKADAAVLAGIERLAATGRHARSAPSSPESLVRRMEAAGLADGLDKKDISAALSRLMDAGKVQEVVVGKMANRSDDRLGLVLAPPALASESDALAPSVAALALPLGCFSTLGEQEQGESASIEARATPEGESNQPSVS